MRDFETVQPSEWRSRICLGETRWSAPDGKQAADHKTRITLSIGENGHPQLDVDDRIEGRAPFIDVDGAMTYLSPDSYVQAHFRAELTENGTLRLLEAPSYGFDLQPDDFQKQYPSPTIELVERLKPDDVLVVDVLEYATRDKSEHHVRALRAVAAFEREPTLPNAKAVVAACDWYLESRGVAESDILRDIRDIVRIAQGKMESYPIDPPHIPGDLFGNLRQMVGPMVGEVLAGMIEAVRRKRTLEERLRAHPPWGAFG